MWGKGGPVVVVVVVRGTSGRGRSGPWQVVDRVVMCLRGALQPLFTDCCMVREWGRSSMT